MKLVSIRHCYVDIGQLLIAMIGDCCTPAASAAIDRRSDSHPDIAATSMLPLFRSIASTRDAYGRQAACGADVLTTAITAGDTEGDLPATAITAGDVRTRRGGRSGRPANTHPSGVGARRRRRERMAKKPLLR
jgi:hypothetical protein